MATQKQIFPITYKPGILRDGSPFQGSYSTGGQWVRFFRGQPQNIGGMKNYVIYQQGIPQILPPDFIPTNSLIYYDNEGNKHILVGGSLVPDSILSSVIDFTYTSSGAKTYTWANRFTNPTNTLAQFVVVISIINSLPTQMILCLGMKNYTDINNNDPISIFAKKETGEFFSTEFPDFVLKEATGGMLYVSNRLFYK